MTVLLIIYTTFIGLSLSDRISTLNERILCLEEKTK